MKENENKFFDEWSEKIIKETHLEMPSEDFTDKVMKQVYAIHSTEKIVYKPLIPKRIWVYVLAFFSALIVYVLKFSKPQKTTWLDSLDFGQVFHFLSNPLSKVTFSNTFVYSFIFLGIMVWLQVAFLKNHFEKHLKV